MREICLCIMKRGVSCLASGLAGETRLALGGFYALEALIFEGGWIVYDRGIDRAFV